MFDRMILEMLSVVLTDATAFRSGTLCASAAAKCSASVKLL
jgi:hypothetical protein